MNHSRPDPAFFIRSFVVVALHYVLIFVVLLFSLLAIVWLGFPDAHKLWTSQPETFRKVWEQTPHLLWPAGMCIALICVNLATSFLIGFQLAWIAPYPKSAHGVFLAVVCVISFLQIGFTQSSVPKWLLPALLLTTPIFIVIGSRMGERVYEKRFGVTEDKENDQSVE